MTMKFSKGDYFFFSLFFPPCPCPPLFSPPFFLSASLSPVFNLPLPSTLPENSLQALSGGPFMFEGMFYFFLLPSICKIIFKSKESPDFLSSVKSLFEINLSRAVEGLKRKRFHPSFPIFIALLIPSDLDLASLHCFIGRKNLQDSLCIRN